MSKAGKRLIESAQQALDFVEGKAETSGYRIQIPDEIDVKRILVNGLLGLMLIQASKFPTRLT